MAVSSFKETKIIGGNGKMVLSSGALMIEKMTPAKESKDDWSKSQSPVLKKSFIVQKEDISKLKWDEKLDFVNK